MTSIAIFNWLGTPFPILSLSLSLIKVVASVFVVIIKKKNKNNYIKAINFCIEVCLDCTSLE